MTRALRFFLPLLLAVGLLPAQPLKYAPYRPGQILIKPKLTAANSLLQALHRTHGATVARVFARLGNIQMLRLPRGITVEQAIALYRANPLVELAEPDYLVSIDQTQTFPNDPSFNQLWGLHNAGQTGGTANADINAPEAWSLRSSASSIIVGVVDTGIDYNHPDLAANMWTNPGEIPNNGIDDDNNGYIDDVNGINAITTTGNPMDDNSHGTHVAGTIGAVGNNGTGVAGVAWNVKLMALKFLSASGSGSTSDAIKCIEYALSKGVHILSNSWGGGGFSQTLYDAINAAKNQGVLFVAAAGNAGSNNDTGPTYPASYDLPNIIAVAATDANDAQAGYSNYGYRRVHLGAPGSTIYSTLPGNQYGSKSGTSMATPHVAGALALLKAQFPALAYDELIRRLLLATDARSNLDQTTLSGGRLNLYRALANLQRPIPHFTASPRSGSPPLTVTFTDSSLGTLTSRTLNAGAGGSAVALNGSTSQTYSTSGTYTAALTVAGPDGAASRSQTIRVQPPYSTASDTYSWIDTTGMTALSLDDDSISGAVALPFSFPFFGGEYNTAYVSANGFLLLGTPTGGTEYTNTAIPNTTAPNNALYPFWDDFDPSTGGTIRYGTSGGSFVVSWENIAHRTDTSRTYPLSFQIVINRWGGVQYNYREVQPARPVFGGGRGATVGIEDEFGSMATQASSNTSALNNLSARRFSRGSVTLSATSATAPTIGGSGNITVTPADPASAAWSVSGQPAWLTVDLSANPHVWTAAANPDPNPRTATLTIGDKTFTLSQPGSPGTVALNPASASAPAAGASGSITVTPTPSTYTSWTTTGNPAWLTVSTTGNTVNWTASPNNSVNARSATLTIGDKTFPLSQAGANGSVALSPTSASAPAAGATGSLTVTPTPADYTTWTVTGAPAWLTVSTTGNTVSWSASANNSVTARSATLTIGDKTFSLSQSGATGSVALSPTSATASAAGATGSITVTPTPPDYTTWTVTGNPAWLTVTTTGNTINWTASSNNSVNSRSATLTIGDQSFPLTQNGATGTVALNASSGSAPAAGGSGSVTVTPSPTDFTTWTVIGNPSWLTVTQTATAVSWTAQANNSVSARSATLTIGDKSYSVNQSGAAGSLTLTPATATVPAAGGASTITVTPTPPDYTTWTVTGNPSWLTVSTSGNTINWNAASNNSVNARSANVTIGDKTFTLNQSGATGSLTLSASSATIPAAGGSGSVTATPTPSDYNSWTVTGQPSWLTVTQSANVVSWSAPAINSVTARTATLTIGNQTYTLTQTGATGAVTLSAASAAAPPTGGSGNFTVTPSPSDFTSWSVTGAPAWLTIATSGNTVTWTAAAINSVNARTATLTISNRTFTLTQAGAAGSITLSASTATVGAIGGSGGLTITPTPSDYTAWTVSGAPPWLIVTTTGNNLSWTAAANNSVAARTATLTIDNRTFTLSQSGATGSVTLSPASASATAAGATGTIAVTPSPADYKTWTVTGAPAWLTVSTNNNTITWTAAPNNSVAPRSATLTIGDKSFPLTQSGATGSVTLSPTSATAPAAGASGSITVTPTPTDFTTWTVTGAPTWLTVSTNTNTITWTAAPNNSVAPRSATLTIGDKSFTLTQSGATGSVSISPTSATAPAAGASGSITVTPTPTDFTTWTVTGAPAWLTVSTNNNTITWTAAPNNSVAPRSATLTIGDKSFPLTQSGATGSVSLSPTSATAPAAGASGSITVTPTPADFTTWTVTGAPTWLTVSTNNNTISWTANPHNSVAPRSATLTIGDKSFTLTQSGATGSVALSPTSASAPAAGASGTITVTPTPTDFTTWTVTGAPTWLTVSTNTNTITWTAAPNNSVAPRSATLTIGDKSFTLTQSGATGSVSLSPTSATAPAAGASGSITVTPTPTDFTTWTVTGAPAWLTVSTTNNTITWTAAPNNSVAPRSATLTIGDKTFTLTQSGATGSVTLSPTAASAPAAGASGTITVTPTPTDFTTWTVTGAPTWLTVSTTNNTISWTAAPNNSVAPRSATLTIGDKSFPLTQAAFVPPPSASDAGPVNGTGTSQTLTFRFSHTLGFQNLDVVNVLINTALDGGNACYIAYSQSAGILYLVGDNGPATLSAPLTLGSTATVKNSQCTVHGSGSSAQGSGNTLTLTLRLTYAASFTGSKVIYTAARDQAAGNSGWKTLGASQIPEPATTLPRTDPLPQPGITTTTHTLTATYRAAGITTAWLLVNSALDAGRACYVAYFVPGNLLLLRPDDGGAAGITAMPLSSTQSLENSQCRLSAQGSSANFANGVLTLTLNLTAKSGLAGANGVWTALESTSNEVSPWRITGNWLVP